MNKIERSLPLVLLLVILFLCCNNPSKKKPVSIEKVDSFKKNLIETRLGKSSLFVSLPSDYKIEENIGPDFEVYYFSPSDTIDFKGASGGFYLGNHPSEFEPSSDSCKTDFSENHVFNKQREWIIYDCGNDFLIQTIIDNESAEDWNQKIHVFGSTKSKDDLDKLMDIYSTLIIK